MHPDPTMRAYVLRRYRADAVGFQRLPRPAAGPGQLLIRVHATGLNPVDTKICDGAMRALRLHRLPMILGSELAGTVVAAHPSARHHQIGARVCLRTPIALMGAFAEYAAVDEALVSRVPDAVDDLTAGGLPLVGLTAWQALHEVARIQPGERVFISAGAGGVGGLAIQLAKLAGTHVATTASPAGTDLVRSLGADDVVDYQQHDPARVLDAYDVAVDLLGGAHTLTAMRTLRPGGRLVSLAGPPEPETRFGSRTVGPLLRGLLAANIRRTRNQARRRHVSYRYLFMRPDTTQLDHLLELAARGDITVPIASTAPADRLGELLAELRQGHAKGKLVATWIP